jgi:hypothetical protein
MGIGNAPRVVELEPVDEIRRQVAALTDASTRRHRLERGTAEYAAALETEARLADRVWRLGASLAEEKPKNPRA